VSEDALKSAVRAIWERSRDAIMQRVASLEAAAQSAANGALTAEARRAAEREAHKLAGAIGTFGFWNASALAKEAEHLLQGDAPLTPPDLLQLSTLTTQLRQQLDAESTPEKKATPVKDAPAVFAKPAHAKLVVVGNDRDFYDRISTEARSLGVDVLEATTATDARRLLADHVDAVILDITLPDAGFQFLDELHAAHPSVAVIVISDSDEFQLRVDAARSGVRGFLQKPVRPSQLIDLLRDVLVATSDEVSTIVAVDDDPELLELLKRLLQPTGARVVTVTDSIRVLNVLVEHAPDLVMLDVDMPGLNGIELCRVLRNDPRWAALPVLFLTSHTEPSMVTSMFESGADDFVAKPVIGPELLARVRNRLERTRMLRLAADVDSLTGVATRRRGIEVLERIFRLAQRQRQPISVAAIDLDHFKHVNDTYGHLVGDMVLRRVATILSTCFRGEDVVARWGGEEFVVAMYSMPCIAASNRLKQALEKLRTEVFEASGSTLKVTFSAGVAEFPTDGADWTSVYRVADDALSRAKTEGRNRVVCVQREGSGATQVESAVDVAIVDEDPVVVALLEQALHARGFRTAWIRDGTAAIEQMTGHNPKLRARVVVLDSGALGHDGYTVLRALSNAGVTQKTRIVMLTATPLLPDVQHALELLAFAQVAKPFSVLPLMEIIRDALNGPAAKVS
jgi:diguanylate cyclase (GGDEF)-like protein